MDKRTSSPNEGEGEAPDLRPGFIVSESSWVHSDSTYSYDSLDRDSDDTACKKGKPRRLSHSSTSSSSNSEFCTKQQNKGHRSGTPLARRRSKPRRNSDSEDFLRGGSRNTNDRFLTALQNLSVRREVMKPEPFNPEECKSLRKFLRSYERYFQARYDGTPKEMSAHLSGFLLRSAKSAYSALGGQDMKYDRLKNKLLRWYDAQRVDLGEAAHENFHRERMRSTDTCLIYCLRLQQMANCIFKDSKAERDSQLRRKLMKTAPDSFCKQVENAESVLSIVGDGELSWGRLKRLAETHDRKIHEFNRRDPKAKEDKLLFFGAIEGEVKSHSRRSRRRRARVSFANELTSPEQDLTANQGPRKKDGAHHSQSRSYRGRGAFSRGRNRSFRGWGVSTRGGTLTAQSCRYCGKTNHTLENCWIRQGFCIGCGGVDHWIRDCQRLNYRGRYSVQESQDRDVSRESFTSDSSEELN